MLERAGPEVRVRSAHSQRLAWGIPDVILAVLMLPFGLAVLLIERMVWVATVAFSE
jgi:hypothetical protein